MPNWLFWTIGGIIATGGLTLLTWALFWDRSRARRRCPKCWYDMSGVPGMQCPECGKEARQERHFSRTRRRYRLAFVGMALILSGYGAGITPRILQGGWPAAIPVPVLNFVLDFAGKQAEQDAFSQLEQNSWKASALSRWERMLAARYSAKTIKRLSPFYSSREVRQVSYEVMEVQNALASLGTEARVAIPFLEDALYAEENAHSRTMVVETLGSVASDCPAAAYLLADTLRNGPSLSVQRVAAIWLINGGLESNFVFSVLSKELRRNTNADVRSMVVRMLPRTGVPDKRIIEALVIVLKTDSDSQVRSAAATALGGFVEDGADLADPLISALNEDDSPTVRSVCARFLGYYQTQQAVEALGRAVRTDEQAAVRIAAAMSLGRIGPAAADAVPDVQAAIEDPDQSIGPLGVVVLAKIGEPAFDALVQLLDHDRILIQRHAIDGLHMLANTSTQFSPRLVFALSDEDVEVRYLAARTLGRIGEAAGSGVLPLIGLTQSAQPQSVRLASIDALSNIEPQQSDVVQALIDLLGDTDASIRQAAAAALVQSGASATAAVPALETLVQEDPIAGPMAFNALRAIREDSDDSP